MAFPEGVVLTTVTDQYLDAVGKPVKGSVVFIPDLSAVGEGIAVAPVPVRKPFDSTGKFQVAVPASVNTGLDPDFTYEVLINFSGSIFLKKTVQIPVSEDPVILSDLIDVPSDTSPAKFKLPEHTTPPANPQPGQMYYNTEEGIAYYYDDVNDVWVGIGGGGGGGGGTPTGPAGGSLAGTYPNPTLKANSVGTTQLADASVTAAKLSVSYVPTLTYNNDLATTALALGDLQVQIDGKAATIHTHAQADVTGLTAALAAKAPTASPTFTGTVSGITKSMVGLGNVDNTSDANKPISNAVSTALGAKADLVGGVVPVAQIPAIAIVDFLGSVANQAAMLALVGQKGDWTIRTDVGQVYVITGSDPTQLADWTAFAYPTAPVTSVAGRTGIVILTKSDVGLANVDNTSDANKPVSSATQTALNLKAPSASPTFTGTVSGITKAMVGLANVDNTSDANKPISNATQTALNLKADTASLATVATSGDYNDLINAPGGGGTAPTFVRAYITSGDFPNTVDGVWTPVSGLTIAIPAAIGDDVEAIYGCLLDLGVSANNFYDPCVLVGGSIVRFASTGTGTSAGANEGDPAIYPNAGSRFRGANVSFAFTATSGDISGGNITFGIAHIGPGGGKVFANTNYPFRWHVRNDH